MGRMTHSLVAVVALLTTVNVAKNCQKYCKMDSCPHKSHTMCKYRSTKPAKACHSLVSASLSRKERKFIVKAHNKFRSYVARGNEKRGSPGPQPPGRIPKLKWSYELQRIAQRWANQCTYGHDKCRNVSRFKVGQNVAIKSCPKVQKSALSKILKSMYGEVKKFNSQNVESYDASDSRLTGHYTQIIWGATRKIGCGAVKYLTPDSNFNFYLVCNYGPAGNIHSQPVYQTNGDK